MRKQPEGNRSVSLEDLRALAIKLAKVDRQLLTLYSRQPAPVIPFVRREIPHTPMALERILPDGCFREAY
jgi:hypothetical protein